MRLVPFKLNNGYIFAVNPDQVCAIVGDKFGTTIFAGNSNEHVNVDFETVFAVLQAEKCEAKDGDE